LVIIGVHTFEDIIRSKQIHRNNKIRLHKTLIKPVLCYGSVTWTLTHVTKQTICTFERKLLRKIYGQIQDEGCWRPRWNSETYNLYKDLKFVNDMKIRRLGWARHVVRMEDKSNPKKVLNGEFHNKRPVGKPRTRWADVVKRDTPDILGIRGWKRRAEDKEK